MKIVFMGTPEFAKTSLAALVEAEVNVAAVVTMADKPAGRGQKLTESAVKKYAVEQNIPVLQPLKLKDPDFLADLALVNADLFVVVAFRMLPEAVWNMPPKGTINLHASLLPQYRGAAPINHVIINGEKETGATTFFLKQEIDTGDIIFSECLTISDQENAGSLHDRLMHTGANLLVKTVKAIESGNYSEIPQPQSDHLKSAPKIFKDFCKINWDQDSQTIYNLIRGLSPYPAAFTTLQDKSLKVFAAEIEQVKPQVGAGQFLTDGKSYLKFACPDAYIKLKEVQYEGKKRMPIDEFLRGIRL